ncbi:MAG: class I SAM-dependent methyltransferase [Crocinitomicaceae bacterium]|nr:class I SAM-dependent methyltransferase [Crocinitomicaceae bacterium]
MADQYKNTIETWRKLATAYHEKFKDLTIYNETYEAFVSYLNSESPSLLEIGCGPGTVTKWLKNRLPKASILATDVAPEMIEEAKKHIEGVEFEVADARTIHEFNQKFDAIFAGFIVPYLTKVDLGEFISSASTLLNTKGVFYVSCIEKNYSESFTQTGSTGHKMTVHFYLEKDLLSFFDQHQLEHLQIIRVNYPLPTGDSDTHLIILGQKN